MLGTLLILVTALVLFIFWLSQMIVLMRMKDDDFPGRHDKILWFVAVFVGFAAGALAFRLWRPMRSQDAASDRVASKISSILQEGQKQADQEANQA